MSGKKPLVAAGFVAVGAGIAFLTRRARYDRSLRRLVKTLYDGTDPGPRRGPDPGDDAADDTPDDVTTDATTDLDGLPAPVRRYLRHVLPADSPVVETARLEHRGEFRLGDADSAWSPLESVEHVRTDPAGFVWDGTVRVAGVVPIRVVDAFVGGRGVLRARLLSAVTVADAGTSRRLDEAELARYLAEAVWYPTALLPGGGVTWRAIDDDSAEATVESGGTTASVVFHVDDRDEVTRVTAGRWYLTDDGDFESRPWTGRFRDYHDRGGVLVPASGEVAWTLDDGDLPYWRATLTGATYR